MTFDDVLAGIGKKRQVRAQVFVLERSEIFYFYMQSVVAAKGCSAAC